VGVTTASIHTTTAVVVAVLKPGFPASSATRIRWFPAAKTICWCLQVTLYRNKGICK